MGATVTIVQAMLAGAALLAIVRALRGPTLTDRIVALDLVLLLFAGGLAALTGRLADLHYDRVYVHVLGRWRTALV